MNGRATEINIRGLSGDFANTLLNGREQVSTGNNRSVEFDQYPSELLSGVLVYKTPHSSLVGQGLSGTIDLQTVRPLAVGKRTVNAGCAAAESGGNKISQRKARVPERITIIPNRRKRSQELPGRRLSIMRDAPVCGDENGL